MAYNPIDARFVPRYASSMANKTQSVTKQKTKERKIIRLPYLKKLGKRGTVTIWRVDGSYIRTHKDEEFTNYGHHYSYRYIPKDEFWIDQGASPEEEQF